MKSERAMRPWLAAGGALGLILAFTLATLSFADERQTEEFHRTYSLSSTGRVSLDNLNGDVHITGWDRNQVEVEAVKSVRSSTLLSDVTIKVDSSPDSLHIETRYPQRLFGESHWRVDYRLMVPRRARLDKIGLVNGALLIQDSAGEVDGSSVNGRIRVKGLSGPVSLSAMNGTISAIYDDAGITRSLSLETVNGSISLVLPRGTNALVRASTINGRISSEFPIAVSGGFAGRSVDGKLGSGGAAIRLRTVNGSIAIHRGTASAN